MLTQFSTIGVLMLLTAMLPGPDFALVTRNTIAHSRLAGLFTSLGINCAVMVHMTYCLLGFAILISELLWLFNIIKYLGAAYLIYLGIRILFSKQPVDPKNIGGLFPKTPMTPSVAFKQGFLCNLLNPKATLFFLAMFTVVIKPGTSLSLQMLYAIEMVLISTLWFCALTLFLSHPSIMHALAKSRQYIEKTLGIILVGFGAALALVKQN